MDLLTKKVSTASYAANYDIIGISILKIQSNSVKPLLPIFRQVHQLTTVGTYLYISCNQLEMGPSVAPDLYLFSCVHIK